MSVNINAQCTVHGVGTENSGVDLGAGDFLGQTFEACQTGEITSISLALAPDNVAGTHNLRIGASPNPPTALLGGAVYQTFTTAGGAESLTITLGTPFPVIAGNTYAFEFELGANMSALAGFNIPGGDYPDGNVYQFGTSDMVFIDFDRLIDLDFEVAIAPPVAVPTLSQWGLFFLSLLILTFGTVVLRREKTVLVGANGSNIPTRINQFPFDKMAFSKMFIAVMIGFGAIFTGTILGFGYEMTEADLPGSLASGALLAYLLILLKEEK